MYADACTDTHILKRYFNITWGHGSADKISPPGAVPDCLLWFALWDSDQAFVLSLSHTFKHTLRHTQPGSAAALPVRPPKRPNDEALEWGVKRTRLAKKPCLRTRIVIITVITKEAILKRTM